MPAYQDEMKPFFIQKLDEISTRPKCFATKRMMTHQPLPVTEGGNRELKPEKLITLIF